MRRCGEGVGGASGVLMALLIDDQNPADHEKPPQFRSDAGLKSSISSISAHTSSTQTVPTSTNTNFSRQRTKKYLEKRFSAPILAQSSNHYSPPLIQPRQMRGTHMMSRAPWFFSDTMPTNQFQLPRTSIANQQTLSANNSPQR